MLKIHHSWELGLGDDHRILFTHFTILSKSLDGGLVSLMVDEDVIILLKYVFRFEETKVFIKTDVSLIKQHCDSNLTLKNHISHPHCEALKRVLKSRQLSMSRDGSIFVYNSYVLREQFAGLVIQRGLPFNHFDDEQTMRVFQKHLQPKYMVELLIESISTDLEFFDDSYATKAKKWFNNSLKGLYNTYYAKYGNPTTESSSWASLSRASGENQMSRLLNRLQEHTKKKARNDPSLSSEYERYVNTDFVTLLDNSEFAAFDLLGFWKTKESMFLVLSRMAMDIISVQATSVASESAFSTSGRVLSIRRTRLTPTSLELCMCLKDHLDAQERKQHKSGLENPRYFKEEILDADVQQNEAIPLSKEEIALDIASSEGTMSGYGYDYE
nr:zinc finger BED domain-containing protein RICESLEEPER 2 [Tanacetum cinerariifolium]